MEEESGGGKWEKRVEQKNRARNERRRVEEKARGEYRKKVGVKSGAEE